MSHSIQQILHGENGTTCVPGSVGSSFGISNLYFISGATFSTVTFTSEVIFEDALLTEAKAKIIIAIA